MSDDKLKVGDTYLEQMVEGASSEGLLLLLVDGAVKFIRRALFALEKEKFDEVHNCLVKAQNIYIELTISIDLDAGEFAENLAQVYQFIYNLLIEANLDKDEQKINSALRLAEDIRDLWKETIDKSKATEEEDSIEDSKPELKQESGESTVELYTPVDAQTIVKTKADDSGTDFRLNLTG